MFIMLGSVVHASTTHNNHPLTHCSSHFAYMIWIKKKRSINSYMFVLCCRDDFRDYSELCFKLFGDRVKHWFTFNEPRIIASYGYELGIAPPGRCSLPKDICVFKSPVPGKCFMTVGPCNFGGNSSTEPYIVAHNLILAHATVAKLYREKYQVFFVIRGGHEFKCYTESHFDQITNNFFFLFLLSLFFREVEPILLKLGLNVIILQAKQKGEVGIVLVTPYYVPYSKSQEDQDAANRLFDFYLGW